jgi:hypothetical protein
MQLRLIYFCKPDEILCSRCHKTIMARFTVGADYTIVTCSHGGGGRAPGENNKRSHCGECLLLIPGTKRTTCIRITKSEAALIDVGEHRANDVLRDIGALVEAIRDLERAAS